MKCHDSDQSKMPAEKPKLIITGGAGFIGSALCRHLVRSQLATVINLDALTYAANLASLEEIVDSPDYHFCRADIRDAAALADIFEEFDPDGVIHLAAESHVDSSIRDAGDFVETNFVGTYRLLEAARSHWEALPHERRSIFRFLNVSTDEVYGSLDGCGLFTEQSRYNPSSPYSASKAGADHLVNAWQRTYGLPILIAHSSNTYGPYQFPEKLIPLMILNCLHRRALPVYGDGTNVRDWLYVDDHAKALWTIWRTGQIGESYNVGGGCERRNIDVVKTICRLLDHCSPNPIEGSHEPLISFVNDRPGHDLRYAMDGVKLEAELGWQPEQDFVQGIERAVRWYLDHPKWWRKMFKSD